MSSDTGTVATRVTSSRFIGRSRELAELEAALADASAGRPSLAFIAGESGVGKTRLLKELERGALAADARVVSGDCVSLGEDELPYAPIVAALRSLTRDGDPVLDELGPATRAGLASLLPELAPATGAARHGPRRAGAVARLRGAARPCSTSSAATSRSCWPSRTSTGPTPPRAPSSPSWRAACAASACCVVATYRPDELHRRHPLRPLLAELERGAARAAHRARAADAATSSPSSSRTSSARRPTTRCVERLYARSEGNPLFTEELLAAGLDGRGELPPTLRDALMVRIEAPAAGRPGGAARRSPSGAASTTRCWPRPRGLDSARAARGAARGGRPAT